MNANLVRIRGETRLAAEFDQPRDYVEYAGPAISINDNAGKIPTHWNGSRIYFADQVKLWCFLSGVVGVGVTFGAAFVWALVGQP